MTSKKGKILSMSPEYGFLVETDLKDDEEAGLTRLLLQRLKGVIRVGVARPISPCPEYSLKIDEDRLQKTEELTAKSLPFGQMLRGFRESLGITQQQLAKLAVSDRAYISRIEREKLKPPKISTALILARALRLDPEQAATLANATKRISYPITAEMVSKSPHYRGEPLLGN